MICASGPDGVLGGHKNLYWFGRNVATSSLLLLVLSALVCSRGNKRAREGAGPKSLVNGSKGVESHSTPFPSPVMGHSTSPFIDEGEDVGYIKETEREKSKEEEGLRGHGALHLLFRGSHRSCR